VTVALEIRDAVIEALNDAPLSGVPQASKRRVMPGEPIEESFIAVFLDDEAVSYPGNERGPLTARNMGLLIEHGIVTDDLSAVDDLIEPLREHVVERLGDTNLGGLATSVIERGIPEGGRLVWKLDRYNAICIVRFEVRYQTARANLSERQ
jgi:hypothetical protein